MRRPAALLAVLLLCGCGAPQPRRVPTAGIPLVVTDSVLSAGGSDTLRLGRLHEGEILFRDLRLVNASSAPLLLADYRRSCGCTTLEYDARPLAAGDTTGLRLYFDSRGERGWQFKSVELLFAGRKRPFRLFVEAEVE